MRVRDAQGTTFDLFNTHVSLPAFLEVGPTRVPEGMGRGSNQLHEIDTLLEFVKSHTSTSAILVGDFNTAPHSPVYERILSAGLVDAFALANALTPEELRAHATAGFGPRRMHIDHVFSTPNVRWEAVEGFQFGVPHVFHGVSDHTPKFGRFSAPARVPTA